MRLRQSPMIEASALMGIAFILFMLSLWVIQGDLSKAMANGPLLAALLLFPSFVLWAVFGQVTRDATVRTRFLVAIAVVMAVAAGGAFLIQPGDSFNEAEKVEAIARIAQVIGAFAISGILAAVLTFFWLVRESSKPDPTLITKPVLPPRKKKRR